MLFYRLDQLHFISCVLCEMKERYDSALLQHIPFIHTITIECKLYHNLIGVLDYRPHPNRRCFLFVSGRIRESIEAVIGYNADCSNINVGKTCKEEIIQQQVIYDLLLVVTQDVIYLYSQ